MRKFRFKRTNPMEILDTINTMILLTSIASLHLFTIVIETANSCANDYKLRMIEPFSQPKETQ